MVSFGKPPQNTNSVNEVNSNELSRQACVFAENVVKKELSRDALAEMVGTRIKPNLRCRFS
jgi:hypothetical protein